MVIWKVFGGMSIISNFLIVNIKDKFSVFNSLVNRIKNRDHLLLLWI